MHRCMHCSLRKELRCMHSLFERRRPGHASLFDRGLVSLVRCRKPVPNYFAASTSALCRVQSKLVYIYTEPTIWTTITDALFNSYDCVCVFMLCNEIFEMFIKKKPSISPKPQH